MTGVSSKRQMFLAHVGQTSTYPLMLEIERAEGVFIYDTSGKRYFDLNSGISVSSLGHCHPRVVSAIKAQVDKHMHTMVYGEHVQTPQVEYAQLLTSQLDASLNSIYFLNSGSEVVEAAMKLSKRATGRYEIISARKAYHGSTQGAETLRSDHSYSRAFLPLIPGVRHIEFNNLDELERISCRTAAVIVEPVQAEAGVIPPDGAYLQALRERCTYTKTLLVLDEIQTGFGRTGALFAHQKYGIVPDLMCIGKAMGGGMPIGGLVKATLEVLLSTDHVAKVNEKENYIRNSLQHPIVKEVRSSGLMMAVELTRRKYLKHIVGKAFEEGALIDYFLFNDRSFRLAPPLVYTMEELEAAMTILVSALDYAQNKYN